MNPRRATALRLCPRQLLLYNRLWFQRQLEDVRMRATAPIQFSGFLARAHQIFDERCYQSWQHDDQIRTSQNVHPFVRVYYSPTMWTWLTNGDRDARIVDGSVMVKEQYPDETGSKLLDWTIMVRDSSVWDGWYWADIGNGETPPIQVTNGCAEPTPVYTGYGSVLPQLSCVDSGSQGTFATTLHVQASATSDLSRPCPQANQQQPSASEFNPLDDMHHGRYISIKEASGSTRNPLTTPQCSTVFPQQQAPRKSYCMVPESFDHVVPYGRPAGPQAVPDLGPVRRLSRCNRDHHRSAWQRRPSQR